MKSSSFVRRGAAVRRDPGTLPGPYGQTLVSTGLADMDRLLGGGLPLGCLLLILEDSPPEIATMLLRYFLAEGAAAGHACCWAAPADLPDEQLWLPQRAAQPHQQRARGPAAANGMCQRQAHSAGAESKPQPQPQQQDHLRIAWQYRRYMGGRADAAHAPHPAQQNASARDKHAGPAVTTTVTPVASGWCHSFDISTPQPAAEMAPAVEVSRHSRAADVAALAAVPAASAPSIRRIAVQSLGRSTTANESFDHGAAKPAAAWHDNDVGTDSTAKLGDACLHSAAQAAEVVRALFALKQCARRNRCAVMVTVPGGEFEPALAVRLQHMADAVVALEAIAPDAELLQILPEPDTCRGMLRVVKLPGVGALAAPHPEVDLLLVRRLPRRLALQPVDVDPDAADALLEAQQSDAAAGDVKDVQDDLDDDESDSVNTIGMGTGPGSGGMLCGGGSRQGGIPNPLDF